MQARQPAQDRGVAAVVRGLRQQLGDRVEVGLAGAQGGGDQCGVLVVGVDSDAKIRRRKGDDRPMVPEDERLELEDLRRATKVVARTLVDLLR